jgi:thiamine biosynthesis lipoprotein
MLTRCKPLLGTFVEISIDHDDDFNAIEHAFNAITKIQELMGFHQPKSELNRINRHAHTQAVDVHPWTAQVLRIAKEIHRHSHGLFNCGIGHRLVAAGLLPRHIDYSNHKLGGIEDICFLTPELITAYRPVCLDLGGIAKGFAVDKAIEALQLCGAKSGYVNAGGDLRVFGNTSQEIQVRNPSNPSELISMGSLQNGAVASSGLYYCDNSKPNQGHIVNPQTMKQIEFTESYTVIAPECIYADALTKVFAISKDNAHPCFEKYSAQAIGIAL